jgi:membrane-associated phospholipid phosphatase
MIAALAWLWRWLVRHEADVRHRWAGFAAHPRVTALRTRFAPQIAFLRARLSPAEFLGLDLTIGAIILIGSSWIFGGIAEDVVTGDPLTVVDREIAMWLHLHATPALTEAMKFLSLLASWPVVTGICLFLALYFVRERSRYRLLALMLTIPGGMLLNGMLKYAFHRSRPAWDDPILMIGSYGFPSGHAMSATLLYGFLAAFGVRKVQGMAMAGAGVASRRPAGRADRIQPPFPRGSFLERCARGHGGRVSMACALFDRRGNPPASSRHHPVRGKTGADPIQRQGAGSIQNVFPAPRLRASISR